MQDTMRLGVPDFQKGGRGAGCPPGGVVKESAYAAYCHSDAENLIDYGEGDAGTVVVTMTFGVMVIDMLFNVAVTFGTMMIDVLLHYSFVVMTPLVIMIPVVVPIMVIPMPITIPTVIPIPVTIAPVMLVAVSMWIPFALMPSVVMSVMCLGAVVMFFASIVVPFTVFATIGPCVAAQRQDKSNQNHACQYELACHVNLLCIGLNSDPCGLFNPYDGSDR